MISANLARFLGNLSLDPGLYEAFESDPETILAGADLSEDDKSLLHADKREWLRTELSAGVTAAPLL